MTAPRQEILKVLCGAHGPFTIQEIHSRTGKRGINLTTIYRTLKTLIELKAVNVCDIGNGSLSYEWSRGHHHHHVVCKGCQRVEIVTDPAVEKIDRFALGLGFTDIEHRLEFFGLCPTCSP